MFVFSMCAVPVKQLYNCTPLLTNHLLGRATNARELEQQSRRWIDNGRFAEETVQLQCICKLIC